MQAIESASINFQVRVGQNYARRIFWEAAGLSLDRANPYGGLLARAMREVGVELQAGHPETLTKEWLHENQGEIDVLHLNWPNYMYDAPDLAGGLVRCLRDDRQSGAGETARLQDRVAVHNLYPHESNSRELDHLAQTAIHSFWRTP